MHLLLDIWKYSGKNSRNLLCGNFEIVCFVGHTWKFWVYLNPGGSSTGLIPIDDIIGSFKG